MALYTFDKTYFDKIDSYDKAYWLGFIWADGSIIYRKRTNGVEEYCLKISLKDSDREHLEKFNNSICGNFPIHIYDVSKSSYDSKFKESRIAIYSKVFVKNIYDNYDIIPHRNNWEKCINKIPYELHKYFIMGLFDGDGSFSISKCCDNQIRYTIDFGGQEGLLKYIEKYLCDNISGLKFKNRKINKRHKDINQDGSFRNIKICGKNNYNLIMDYFYGDKNIQKICLNRKHIKYKNYMKEFC